MIFVKKKSTLALDSSYLGTLLLLPSTTTSTTKKSSSYYKNRRGPVAAKVVVQKKNGKSRFKRRALRKTASINNKKTESPKTVLEE